MLLEAPAPGGPEGLGGPAAGGFWRPGTTVFILGDSGSSYAEDQGIVDMGGVLA